MSMDGKKDCYMTYWWTIHGRDQFEHWYELYKDTELPLRWFSDETINETMPIYYKEQENEEGN